MARTQTSSKRCEVTREGAAIALSLFLQPVPASRPRVTRWGVYYGKTYKTWMKAAEEAIPAAESPMDGPLEVWVRFVISKPKTSKREWPRGDVDNYEKSIYDALTKAGYWHDDDQIVTAHIIKEFARDGEEPATHVHIEKQT